MPDGQYGRFYLKNSHALSLMECMAFLFMSIESPQSVDSIVGGKQRNRIRRLDDPEDWRDGMDEESIRQHREPARTAIRGLISYAEQIARQGKDDEIQQVRSLVDALSLYWGG